jgi:hypothetical protein
MTSHKILHVAARLMLGSFLAVAVIAVPVCADVLQYGGGEPSGKRSFGGGGHLVLFDAGKGGRWLNRIEMYGSRYGMEIPPDEDFHLYIVDANRIILREVSLPYALWTRGQEYWRDLPIPPIQVPQQFGIGLTFNAQQTKGVYVGTTKADPPGHSFSWIPGSPGQPMGAEDWLIRVTLDDEAKGDPKAQDLFVQRTGEAYFDTFLSAVGNPLVLKLAGRRSVLQTDLTTMRLGAVSAPGEAPATLVLANGVKLPCTIVAIDDKTIRTRDGAGNERQFARSDLARIDFR